MERLQVREIVVSYKTNENATVPLSIREPTDFSGVLPKLLTTNLKEHFIAFYLDGNHNVIGYSIVSIGLINSSQIHPREVFQPAIALGAVAVVVAHNHPSGNLKASREDIEVTYKLRESGNLLGITLLDHLIFTHDNRIHSMRENNQGF